MGYLWTLVIAAVALVGLVVLVIALLGPVRRTAAVSTAFRDDLRDRGGMLAARLAALKVLLAQRREARSAPEAGEVPVDEIRPSSAAAASP